MAKKYRTVLTSNIVDRSVEQVTLSGIMSVGGNAFTPADDELSCPSRLPTDEEMAKEAAQLDQVGLDVDEMDEIFENLVKEGLIELVE